MRGNYVRLDYGNSRDIFHNLEHMYYLWGYTLASIPLFDDIDFYTEFLTKQEYEKTIRFVHADGRTLFLRSDITLFLIRFIASHVAHEQLPLRLSYLGEIVRMHDRHDLYDPEILQSGAELIGVGGLEGDAEIILLLQESLRVLDKQERYVHIGSRQLLKTIALAYQCDYSTLTQATRKRDLQACTQLLAELSESVRRGLCELLFFIGDRTEFAQCYKHVKAILDPELRIHCNYLLELCETLLQNSSFAQLRIDISEIGKHTYYSGIVFSVYQHGAPRALASGGRYDDLLLTLTKKETPATGFSLYPLHLSQIKSIEQAAQVTAQSFSERFQLAQANRQKGIATIL